MEIHVILQHHVYDIEYTETTVFGAKHTHEEAEKFIKDVKLKMGENRPSREMVDEYYRKFNEYADTHEAPLGHFSKNPKKSEIEKFNAKNKKYIDARLKFMDDTAREISEGLFGKDDMVHPPEINFEIVPTTLS